MTWTFRTEVFERGEGPGPSWRFARLPVEVADEIRAQASPGRGFGSVRVRATVGATAWNTSVFPEKQSGSYLLPFKKSVRAAEAIEDGDVVEITIELA